MHQLDDFTRAYIEAMLWSTIDEKTGNFFENNYGASDFTFEAMTDIIEECQWFQKTYAEHIAGQEKMAGHDFWLTREGHGSGYWDGDWEDPAGTELYEACKPFNANAMVWEENGNLHYQSHWLDRHRKELKRAQEPVINSTRLIDLGDL